MNNRGERVAEVRGEEERDEEGEVGREEASVRVELDNVVEKIAVVDEAALHGRDVGSDVGLDAAVYGT